jgi:2-polyprenyl-3-methyl-5-hydroxy-6-metoxy-1,4-benzoquinol methylase
MHELAIVEMRKGNEERIESGKIQCLGCRGEFEIVRFIPRFVSSDNYASGFGFEWLKHAKTQYDKTTMLNISERRFFTETDWPKYLKGEVILEVGSGSGRFTEHAVSTGAMVISMDYSNAVEANFASNGNCENLLIFQGDLYDMPLLENAFDKILCIGVLQHTPNVKNAFMSLVKHLKPGGNIVIDVYRKAPLPLRIFQMKYMIRSMVRRKSNEHMYALCKRYIDLMWTVAKVIDTIPKFGRRLLMHVLLVPYYRQYYKEMPQESLREWAYLDLFDMLSPAYDNPQSITTVRNWFFEAGLIDIDIHYGYNGIEGRGTRPN